MTAAQTALARRRLWLGITNVGAWVLAATGGLLWLVVHAETSSSPVNPRTWAGLGIGALAVQAGFDGVGGGWLMPAPRPAPGAFFARWLRGVLGHTLILVGVGFLSLTCLRLSGGFGLAILVATVGLALGRKWMLGMLGGIAIRKATLDDGGGDEVLAAGANDPAFTGGIVGLGRGARSLLPAGWLEGGLLPGDLAVESSRRRWQIAHALPGRSLALILGGNLLGAYVGSLLFRWAERPPAEALFGHACWMTLWAFGGLLVLPALSRGAVFAADRAALDAGHDPHGWITHFPGMVGEDGGANPAVQAIFYPVPSAARRLEALDQPRPVGFVAGNLARNNLYYSWATLTPLGRAVHCNVGRPALWVFPPSA